MINSTWNIVANFSLPLNESSKRCFPYGATDSTSDQALMTTGYAILFILSLLGNVLVITVFYKRYNQLRTPVNYFIVNMAASDLLVPLFVVPRRIQQVYLGWYPWLVGGVFGDILCKMANIADEVSVTVSSQSMVFIAAERFWSIVFPSKSPLISRETTPRFICFTWIFSFIFFSYYLFAFKLADEDGTLSCDYGLPQIFDTWQDLWRADRLSLLVTFVVIPFVLLTALYLAIIVSLHRKQKNASHLGSEAIQRRSKENQRVTLMLVTVVAVFFVAWTPFYIYFFVQYYSLGTFWTCDSIKRLYLSGTSMNYIYTAINPLIYYTFNTTYRQGFHKLLRCPWSCPRGCRQNRVHVLQVSVSRDSRHPKVVCLKYSS